MSMPNGEQEPKQLSGKFRLLDTPQAACCGAPNDQLTLFLLYLRFMGDALKWQWQPLQVYTM